MTRFTAFFNLTGLPAISLPCDCVVHGMPIDMQRVSDHRQEAKRLRAAYTWKQTTACLALSDEKRWEPFW
jgi:Asp-tRNA(Asn)/Glu-tRNA(Gln) amidotransferase A subunit family amidase